MAEKDGGLVDGLLIGGLIGVAIGILFAPKSGKETRRDIADKADELLVKAREEYEKATVKSKEAYEVAVSRLKEAEGTAREKAEEIEEKIKEIEEKARLLYDYLNARINGKGEKMFRLYQKIT